MSDIERGYGSFRASAIACPFENLVALHVRCPSNQLGAKFPINLLLEVEEHHVSIQIKPGFLERIGRNLSGRRDSPDHTLRLRVRLRFCYIRYRSHSISIVGDSKYESSILEGTFDTRTAEKSHAALKSELGAGLGTKISLKPTTADASMGVHVNTAFGRHHNHTVEETTTSRPAIYEVQAVPNGWRVGHPEYGDPSKPSRCLDGRYFDRPVHGVSHTCEAEFREGWEQDTLMFTVTVRDGFHVERIGGGSTSHEEKRDAVAVMRDRIAALRLERYLRSAEGSEERFDDEMPIATVICNVVRANDDEIGNQVVPKLKDTEQTQKPSGSPRTSRRRAAS